MISCLPVPRLFLIDGSSQMYRAYHAIRSELSTSKGLPTRAVFGFTPPSIGRYRARAEYLGTRTSSPSETGYARVLVATPLRGD